MKLFRKKEITAVDNQGRDTGPYLIRRNLIECRFGSIKLHHILRSDEDRDLHDHPWSFVSLILVGGYWEHRPTIVVSSRETVRRWHGPGAILYRPIPSTHRLELPAGRTAWTLVITGPKRRDWGFYTICGWIPAFRYLKAKAEGC